MNGVDWGGLWAVFSGTLTVYVLAKMVWNYSFDLYVKIAWRKYTKSGVMILALFFQGCATNGYVPIVRVPEYSDAYARTMCGARGEPVVVVYANTPKDVEYYIGVHELMHVTQIRREKDCNTFMKRYTTSVEFRLKTEAEAECAMFDAYEEDGYEPNQRALVNHVHARFPEFSEADIVEALPCIPYSPGGHNETPSPGSLPQRGGAQGREDAPAPRQTSPVRYLAHAPASGLGV